MDSLQVLNCCLMFTCAVMLPRPGQMLTCPITSETRRCTKLPSLGERYVHTLPDVFLLPTLLSCLFRAIHPLNQFNHVLIRRLSCCCCAMMHVPRSSTGPHRFPRTSLRIQRSEPCWKVSTTRRSFIGLFGLLSHVWVSSLTLACAFIVLVNTSGRENRRKETGGGTSGGCAGRRSFNVEPAG